MQVNYCGCDYMSQFSLFVHSKKAKLQYNKAIIKKLTKIDIYIDWLKIVH